MDTIENLQMNQLEGTEEQRQLDSLRLYIKSLKETSLDALIEELENRSKTFSTYYKRTEAQWEKYCGLPGIDIYNYLHSKQEDLTEGQKYGRFIELCVWIYRYVDFIVFLLTFTSEAVAGMPGSFGVSSDTCVRTVFIICLIKGLIEGTRQHFEKKKKGSYERLEN
ncbi:hypothetical protein HDV04_000493 [Boothiomyces sp. JEL0838]|nr:hypothetical protein HDV04_000493 [Boothiomyces sp. JEL0838]